MKPVSPPAPVAATVSSPVSGWLLAALLVLMTLCLYWPLTRHGFINYDDEQYVSDNSHVIGGLTLKNVRWAFQTGYAGNWHPMTWLSHMADCQLFGLNPWGHHLTNLLWHTINTVLVFCLLHNLTGTWWRSAFVAALFAVHPLHVESVAWVAERKDVLSTGFGLLALICYVRYAQAEIQNSKFKIHYYLLSLLCLALGLMSKPMLVTWPFVLLLLDYWPLKRISHLKPVLLEKIPFLVLAAVTSLVTFMVQKQGGAMVAGANLSFSERGANALITYCRYFGKLFWPTDLAVFYPRPGYWPEAQVLLAGLLIIGIAALLWLCRKQYPFVVFGGLWFFGTLVPVIGLVQVGEQAMADRYTYIPSLGVFILVVWGVYELTRRWQYQVISISVAGFAVIVMCFGLARQQLSYWQDSETLFRHALAVTSNNHIAHTNLGYVLRHQGRTVEAIAQLQEAIRLKPDNAVAHNGLGAALLDNGQLDEAISQCLEAVRLNPFDAENHNNLGAALEAKGRLDEAIACYREAVRLNPDYALAHDNLGALLGRQGWMEEAISELQLALHLNPDDADAHNNLGIAFRRAGRMAEAITQYQAAIRLKPTDPKARYNLGVALQMSGRLEESISAFQAVLRLKPEDAQAHNNLGSDFGMKGQTGEAIRQFQEALRLKPDYVEASNNLVRALAVQPAPGRR